MERTTLQMEPVSDFLSWKVWNPALIARQKASMFDEVLKILEDGSWQEFAQIINKRCIDHAVVKDMVLQTLGMR